MRRIFASVLTLITISGGATSATLTDEFTDFWVLGDSLSDAGNLFDATGGTIPASPPYFDGRFSDGPIWADQIQAEFTDAGLLNGNFAFGGATSSGAPALGVPPSLDVQLGLLAGAAGGVLSSTSLVSLWFGANDIFDTLGTGDAAAAAVDAANNVTMAALTLNLGFGVESFIIPNLNDLADTPRYNLFEPALAADATAASAAFNTQLALNIAGLKLAGLTVFDIDIGALVDAGITDPASFGITDTVLPCVFPTAAVAAAFGQPELCSNPTDKLFFDFVHPSSVGHTAIANLVRDDISAALTPIPLPATAPLLFFAIAGLGFAARRRVS